MRRTWSQTETLAILECYSNRREEFENSRKKKFAYFNVLADLKSLDVLDPKQLTTIEMLDTRMKSLLRTYRGYKDIKYKGAISYNAVYMDYMEDLFGQKLILLYPHNLNLSGVPIKPLNDGAVIEYDSAKTIDSVEKPVESSQSPQLKIKQEKETSRMEFYKKDLALKKLVREQKIQLHRILFDEMERNTERRHRESEDAKERRHKEKLELLKKLIS